MPLSGYDFSQNSENHARRANFASGSIAKIFGAKKVVSAAEKIIESKPNSQEREFALSEFYEAMKSDLNN